MTRTTIIAFPITLFLAWWLYIVDRAGNGPGLQWDRIPNVMKFTVAITGLLYMVFVAIALTVLYFSRVRAQGVAAASILMPALTKFVATYVIATILGSALGETFCLVEERAFRNEATAFLANAKPDPVTQDMPMYSRKRWWPASAQLLVWPFGNEK